jgi:hypothetical protein
MKSDRVTARNHSRFISVILKGFYSHPEIGLLTPSPHHPHESFDTPHDL